MTADVRDRERILGRTMRPNTVGCKLRGGSAVSLISTFR